MAFHKFFKSVLVDQATDLRRWATNPDFTFISDAIAAKPQLQYRKQLVKSLTLVVAAVVLAEVIDTMEK